MEWTRATGIFSHMQCYSVDGPCPTICTDGVNVYDPRDGAQCYRKLHSSELMAIQGFHPGYKFPFELAENERVRLIGLSMDGHCVRALGTALADYIHGVNTPAPLITCSSVITTDDVQAPLAFKAAPVTKRDDKLDLSPSNSCSAAAQKRN